MAKPGQPSRKLFVRDLKSYELWTNPLDGSTKEWHLKNSPGFAGNMNQPLKFVWLQGVVEQCQSADTFMLGDGTGTALVGGCSKIPSVCPTPQQGRYFMVIGELKANDDVPAVKAFKIQDLSGSEALRQMWPLEVLDMNNYHRP